MTDREKLAELLEGAFERFIDDPFYIPDKREFADHLLAHGVIVLPCKVGDTVYCDICNEGRGFYDECIVKSIEIEKDFTEPLITVVCYERAAYQTYWARDFGKDIFLTPTAPVRKQKRR